MSNKVALCVQKQICSASILEEALAQSIVCATCRQNFKAVDTRKSIAQPQTADQITSRALPEAKSQIWREFSVLHEPAQHRQSVTQGSTKTSHHEFAGSCLAIYIQNVQERSAHLRLVVLTTNVAYKPTVLS